MKRILITTSSFDVNKNVYISSLIKAGFEVLLNPYSRRLTESEAQELFSDNSIVGIIAGVEPITPSVISGCQHLKVISRCGVGMDNVNLKAAKEAGITVSNTPDAPINSVAELTLALILNVLRRVSEADSLIRQGQWKPLKGHLLSEQIVGLIGFGRIGQRVCQLLQAFGTTVYAYDTVCKNVPVSIFKPIDALLEISNIISLHVTYGKNTLNLIDDKRLAQMKKGSVLINTSRGGIVDEEALYRSIVREHLSGAGLDTFYTEPYCGELRTLSQVVLTAHMGSYAIESRLKMEAEAAKNLYNALVLKGYITKECLA